MRRGENMSTELKNYLVELIPNFIKYKIMRSLVYVPMPKGKYLDVKYKIAETKEEKEQAYRLVQDNYKKVGIRVRENSDLNLNKYYLLPTTTVFIAKYKDEVVATVSQIMDVGFGLPIDSFTKIQSIRGKGGRVSEFSSLTVKREWRSKHHDIYIPLVFFAVNYCYEELGVDYLVSVTNMKGGVFLKALFGFEKIKTSSTEYMNAQGKKSCAQFLDMKGLKNFFKVKYKSHTREKNFYELFYRSPWKNQWIINDKKYPLAYEPSLSKEDFEYFFSFKSNLLEQMSEKESCVIKNFYFKNYTDFSLATVESNTRKEPRYLVKMNAKVESSFYIKVLDISKDGLQVVLDKKLNFSNNDEISGVIYLNDLEHLSFTAKIEWQRNNLAGLCFITKEEDKIIKFIDYADWYGNQYNRQDNEVLAA